MCKVAKNIKNNTIIGWVVIVVERKLDVLIINDEVRRCSMAQGGIKCFIGRHDFEIVDKGVRECTRCRHYQRLILKHTFWTGKEYYKWQWVLM